MSDVSYQPGQRVCAVRDLRQDPHGLAGRLVAARGSVLIVHSTATGAWDYLVHRLDHSPLERFGVNSDEITPA